MSKSFRLGQYSSDFEGKSETRVIFSLTRMKCYIPCAAVRLCESSSLTTRRRHVLHYKLEFDHTYATLSAVLSRNLTFPVKSFVNAMTSIKKEIKTKNESKTDESKIFKL